MSIFSINKKSINAKDFKIIRTSTGKSPSPSAILKEQEQKQMSKITLVQNCEEKLEGVSRENSTSFLSKIRNQLKKKISVELESQNPQDNVEMRKRKWQNSSPFAPQLHSQQISDLMSDNEAFRPLQIFHQKKQEKTIIPLALSQKKYRIATLVNNLKRSEGNKFKIAHLRSFKAEFQTIKIFDTIENEKKRFSAMSHSLDISGPQGNKQKLNPYQLAIRKKNIKLIKLKINGLGSLADPVEKNKYEELASDFSKSKIEENVKTKHFQLKNKKKHNSDRQKNVWTGIHSKSKAPLRMKSFEKLSKSIEIQTIDMALKNKQNRKKEVQQNRYTVNTEAIEN